MYIVLTADTVAHISLLFQQRSSQFIQKVQQKKTKKSSKLTDRDAKRSECPRFVFSYGEVTDPKPNVAG